MARPGPCTIALLRILKPSHLRPRSGQLHGSATVNARSTRRFDRSYAQAPARIRKLFDQKLAFLPPGDGVTVMLPYDKQQGEAHLVPDEYPA